VSAALVYFAFNILHLDGHDLRRCPLIERKAVLADLTCSAGCSRLLYVDNPITANMARQTIRRTSPSASADVPLAVYKLKSVGSLYNCSTLLAW
jgi:hypothetical protein